MQSYSKSNTVPAEALLRFIAFHPTVHLPPFGLNTCLQRWGSLCGLWWKGPFLVCSKLYWGCCIFSLSLFVAWPAFPCLCNICSPDLRYSWSHLASKRHFYLSGVFSRVHWVQKSGCCDSAAFLSNPSIPCDWTVPVFPAGRVTLCLLFHGICASCWYLVYFMSVLNFSWHRWEFTSFVYTHRS